VQCLLNGTCVLGVGCTYDSDANGTTCDDSNACTTGDNCQGGACVGTDTCQDTSSGNQDKKSGTSSSDKKGTIIAGILIPLAIVIFCAVLIAMEVLRRKREQHPSEEDGGQRVEMSAVAQQKTQTTQTKQQTKLQQKPQPKGAAAPLQAESSSEEEDSDDEDSSEETDSEEEESSEEESGSEETDESEESE